jgi:hypothetical protein
MSPKSLLSATIALMLAACASSGPPPEPDLTGSYEIQTRVEGQPISALVILQKLEDGSYRGSIETGMTSPLSVSSVTREGDGWLIRSSGPEGTVYIRMFVAGEDVTGSWDRGGMGGDFTGSRVGG